MYLRRIFVAMSDEILELERLQDWKARLEERLTDLDSRLRPLIQDVEKTRQQIQIVQRLILLQTSGDVPPAPPPEMKKQPAPNGSITDVVESILREAGKPLHISEIKARFLELGNVIPGRGTESNLLSYIARYPSRFPRVAKGTYTIREGDESAQAPTGERRPRRRMRRKRRTRTGSRQPRNEKE